MTCVIATAWDRGAIIASDTLVLAPGPGGSVERLSESKLARIPGPDPAWFGGGCIRNLSDALYAALCAGKTFADFPAVSAEWHERTFRGALPSENERQRIADTMVYVLRPERQGFTALQVDPATGHARPGTWFTYPEGASPDEPAAHFLASDLIRAQERQGLDALTAQIRALAQFFAVMGAQYGGPNGTMGDDLEIGCLWRLSSGQIVALHRPPGPVSELVLASDDVLLGSLVDGEGRSLTDFLEWPALALQIGKSASLAPAPLLCFSGSGATNSTGETSVVSYNLPANALGTNNDVARITVNARFDTGNVNNYLGVKFGSTILSGRFMSTSDAAAMVQANVVRSGSTSQSGSATMTRTDSMGTTLSVIYNATIPSQNSTGAITIDVRGAVGSTGITMTVDSVLVEYLGTP